MVGTCKRQCHDVDTERNICFKKMSYCVITFDFNTNNNRIEKFFLLKARMERVIIISINFAKKPFLDIYRF